MNECRPGGRRLILKNYQSPGDVVMLTAAVRDLHQCYPNQFITDVRTPCPHLWENNPYLTALSEDDRDVEIIECQYPLIHRSNQAPYHFLHGFIEYLNEQLQLNIRPTAFKGDIHISPLEKSWFSQVEEITGEDTPFWIMVAGGKNDFTIKWWEPTRYQEVVDYFRGKIQFVQVGEHGHHHPTLDGVIDLRGRTDLRQLIRLVYHAQGILTPVSLLMHLAAAVEVKSRLPKNRPCVVVAGGREPVNWEAYPHHQFIHTIGALACCDNGGCWKSRTIPLGDGDEKDRPENLCVDVVGNLPHCMEMITAVDVIRRIEMYFDGGAIQYLPSRKANQTADAVTKTEDMPIQFSSEPQAGHKLFKPTSFKEGMETAVGSCNGIDREVRWQKETPAFAQEILRLLPSGGTTILDYGCGMGRLAKEILKQNDRITVIGIDDSDEQLALASRYVDNHRFVAKKPHQLTEKVDLAYCVYVLQHVAAVEIRELLQRIHHSLKDDGILVYCSSDYRMAVRFDQPLFEDDRRLGVSLRQEIARYFDERSELFSKEILEHNDVLNRIIRGNDVGLAHPALVFKKRIENKPLFNYCLGGDERKSGGMFKSPV